MKKTKKIFVITFLFILASNLFPTHVEARQGFNYEVNNYFKWQGAKGFCFFQECTDTDGSDCNTPGSALRDCSGLPHPIIV